MKGWKTWASAALLILSAGLKATGNEAIAEIITVIGSALGVVGIGHKIEKSGLNKE